MSCAEGMYQFCIDNKFGSGFNEKWGVKHFKVLEDNLMNGEKIHMTYIGMHDYQSTTKHDGNYAYAITNKRIMFGQKTMTGEKFKAVDHERINDISFETGMWFGFLTIDTPQEKIKVALDKERFSKIH
ncbi:PH domain-containing protein (plasmid) [Bacillus cereus]|nr:PH domain-containing protein [Bacillus cereus]WMW41282.1 PH domain-containing protein [Bacillus cereus]